MFELQLPRDSTAPFLARAAIAAIGSGLPPWVSADAELLTSEVVANAIVHTNQDPTEPVVVRVEQGDSLRVEVVDHGPVFEADLRRSPAGEGGFGLFLVDAVATAWGIEAEGTGKKVWFEVGDAMGLVDVYICLQDARRKLHEAGVELTELGRTPTEEPRWLEPQEELSKPSEDINAFQLDLERAEQGQPVSERWVR